METVIKVEQVSKKFKLYYDRPLTLKERLVRGSKGVYKEFYAVKEVSFEVYRGSTVGLIGENGSGKSTLLKMLNRTMFPDEGKIIVKGKVASLIELGAGFHPELSGRENIYNNASIFGFSKEEIEAKIPDIIRFSELEAFIDNPIRTYSSGMYARLAFSVAIHVEADILLVDEILGVGDMNFQAKCANKIYEMRKQGTTILIVTHDMGTIDRLCDYAIWLDHGRKLAEGEPKEIQLNYMAHMAEKQEEHKKQEERRNQEESNKQDKKESQEGNNNQNGKENQEEEKKDPKQQNGQEAAGEKEKREITTFGEHFGNGKLLFTNCRLLNENGICKNSFYTGEKLTLQAEYICQVPAEELYANIGFELGTANGMYLYGTNTVIEGKTDLSLKANGIIEIELEHLELLPGEYTIGIAVADAKTQIDYDFYHKIASFTVYSNVHDIGLVRVKHRFRLDGEVIG